MAVRSTSLAGWLSLGQGIDSLVAVFSWSTIPWGCLLSFRSQIQLPLWMGDTETFLISPGCQAPPVVCGQWEEGNVRAPGRYLVHANDLPYYLESQLRTHFFSFHNLPFDAACISATWEGLLPLVFRALDQDRIICTQVAARMIDIARGSLTKDENQYGLAKTLERLCPDSGLELDKEDPWRLRYGTLYPYPVAQWPEEARQYALKDARAQALVTRAMIQYEETIFPGVFEDLFRQTRKAFWHHLISCQGVRTNRKYVEEYHAKVKADWEKDREIVLQHGLIRLVGKKWTKDTKRASELMAQAWARKAEEARAVGAEPPKPELTKEGKLSLSEDACDQVGDPVLSAYQAYGSLDTLMRKIEKLRVGSICRIQPRFVVPLETGRSSCKEGDSKKQRAEGKPPTAYGFQLQNPPTSPGLRECFEEPVEDEVLIAGDFGGFELAGWAQVCLMIPQVGFSTLAEVLNGTTTIDGKTVKRDAHTELGARLDGISVDNAYRIRLAKDARADAWDADIRQTSKIGNFGFMGMMGAVKLQIQARKQYGVTLSLETCYRLRAAWLAQWPEAQQYFDWILSMRDGEPIVSFQSGFIRGGTVCTERANHFFQHHCGHTAGVVGWAIAKECYLKDGGPRGTTSDLYGCKPWGFLHDEFIIRSKLDRGHEAAARLGEVMKEKARECIPDVDTPVEPTMMRRWAKKAKAVYRDGRLVPWDERKSA